MRSLGRRSLKAFRCSNNHLRPLLIGIQPRNSCLKTRVSWISSSPAKSAVLFFWKSLLASRFGYHTRRANISTITQPSCFYLQMHGIFSMSLLSPKSDIIPPLSAVIESYIDIYLDAEMIYFRCHLRTHMGYLAEYAKDPKDPGFPGMLRYKYQQD
jgi:hypothetical protein